MSQPLFQVDAFTSTAFAGNPAAVCLLARSRPDDWMQSVAAEMNLSETAFLRPRDEGAYELRWFTPTDEVDLCGHATLASAHVLWTEGYVARTSPARFDTRSGTLTAEWDEGWIRMDFPADDVRPTEAPPSLARGLPVPDPVAVAWTGRDYLVHVDSAEVVRRVEPDLPTLAGIEKARGVIVTARAESDEADFVSRFFAPAVGVPEDPVTGSTHCALGPYWAGRLGQTSLTGRQVSARGGTVRIDLTDAGAERITLSGQATTVLQGRLLPDPTATSPAGE